MDSIFSVEWATYMRVYTVNFQHSAVVPPSQHDYTKHKTGVILLVV